MGVIPGERKMKSSIIGQLVLVCILFVGPLTAHAVPVQWTFSGVTFTDGGTANGSFVYDADTNVYSSVNITTTAGTLFPGAVYTDESPGFTSTASVALFVTAAPQPLTGTPAFAPAFAAPLTNAGGTVTLAPAALREGTCNNATCSVGTGLRSFTVGNTITGTAVVIPADASAIPTTPFYVTVLMMLGLLLVGGTALAATKRYDAA
jgi:hypothetical protein